MLVMMWILQIAKHKAEPRVWRLRGEEGGVDATGSDVSIPFRDAGLPEALSGVLKDEGVLV